jgi:hypothetical protein
MLEDFQPSRRPAPARLRDNDGQTDAATPPETTKSARILPVVKAPADTSEPEPIPTPDPPARKRFDIKRFIHKPRNKKQWAMLVAGIVLLAGGITAFALTRPDPPPPVVQKEEPKPEPPAPTTGPSPLTGVEVALELHKRPVTGVMIENSPDARPQAGLKEAGVVFEAVAEGGITRFLALFQEAQPANIGPVRSVRPYYLDFLLPFDAAIAHVGGSPEALAQIRDGGIKDLDQFVNAGAYSRSPNRFAPHNVYTNMAALDGLNQAKGFTASAFTGFPRKPEAPNPAPSAKGIDLAISSFLYNVRYDYVAASNSYNRSEGSRPHLDEPSGAPLSPKVVLALVMNRGIHPDGQHTVYGTTGSGQLYLFQDGVLQEGTWQKADRKSQFVFTDATGAPLKLNPGQTWITLVNAGAVAVTP